MKSSSSVGRHFLSVATLGVPSYVEVDSKFKIKIGAKCFPGECRLAGEKVEVYDHTEEKVATGLLGGEFLPGTTRYWTEVELSAPSVEGRYEWRVKLLAEAPHEEASCGFSFIATKALEYTVTVKVVDKDTKAPVEGAQVMLGLFQAYTDDEGVAMIKVPEGKHRLAVSKRVVSWFFSEPFSTSIEVIEDTTINVELVIPKFST